MSEIEHIDDGSTIGIQSMGTNDDNIDCTSSELRPKPKDLAKKVGAF
jgi:hypothetical protein